MKRLLLCLLFSAGCAGKMPFPVTAIITTCAGANENPFVDGGVVEPSIAFFGAGLQRISNQAAGDGTANYAASNGTSPLAGTAVELYATFPVVENVDDTSIELDLLTSNPATDATPDGYTAAFFRVAGVWSLQIARYDAGAFIAILSAAITPVSGDQIGLRVVNGVVSAYQNGISVASVADATYTAASWFWLVGTYNVVAAVPVTRITNIGGGGLNSGSGFGAGWSLRAVSSVATGTTSLTITKPTGTVNNDILIMCLSHKGAAFATMPAGWTLIEQDLSGAIRGEMYWKRAASEGANYTITGLADTACGFIASYIGGLRSGNIVAASDVAANPSGTELAPAIVTTAPYQLVIYAVAAAANNAITFNGPTPSITGVTYTEIQDGGTANGTDSRVGAAHSLLPSAVSTNALAYALTNTETVAITVALVAEPTPAAGDLAMRFYPTKVPPPVRLDGPYPGTWDATDVGGVPLFPRQWVLEALPTKAGGGTGSSLTLSTNQQGDFDIATMAWRIKVAAQTISGAFDWCWMMNEAWNDPAAFPSDDSDNGYVCHIVIMEGDTLTVRHTLLDHYVDTGRFVGPSSLRWDAFDTVPTLDPGDAENGDHVWIIFAHRVRSSPTPTPLRPQPFNDDAYYTELSWRGPGTATTSGVTLLDAVPGTTSPGNTSFSAWFEFAGGLTLYGTPPTPPANDACADATAIASVPSWSSPLDCSGSTDAQQAVWYTYVAARTGTLLLTAYGSTYQVLIQVYAGTCGALGSNLAVDFTNDPLTIQGSASVSIVTVTAGTTYRIRCSASATILGSDERAGSLQLQVNYQETPADNDLYVTDGNSLTQWRRYPDQRHYLVNVNPRFATGGVLGVALDYTGRAMENVDTGLPNTSVRVLISALFDQTVYILNAPDLSFLPTGGTTFIDQIHDPIDIAGLSSAIPGQLSITSEGMLVIGAEGNGYTYILGVGTLPRQFNTTSDDPSFSAVRRIDATHGDQQAGAPYIAESFEPAPDTTAPAWNSLSADGDTLYYTAGSAYFPVGGQTVKRFSLSGNSQLADVVTLPAGGGLADSVKGLQVLSDGSVLQTNGTYAVWLSASGVVQQTYTPSRSELFPVIGDIKARADGTEVYIWDLFTNAIAWFNLTTGAELGYQELWLKPAGGLQLAIYQPSGAPAPSTTTTEIVPIRRLRRTPVLHHEDQWIFHSSFQLDLQTGIGRDGATTLQGHDPQVMLRWSNNGGKTWSNEHWVSAGKLGQHRRRAMWRRLGRARNRVYEVVVSDPVAWNLLAAYLTVDGERPS